MKSSKSFRKCEACKSCQPMFPKPVERSAKTSRPVAPTATRHSCEKHSHDDAARTNSDDEAVSKLWQQPIGTPESTDLSMSNESAQTGFSNIDTAMAEARAKYATDPSLLPLTEPLTRHTRTPSEADFDERIDSTLVATATAIGEIQKQLATSHVSTDDSESSDASQASADDVLKVDAAPEGLSDITAPADVSTPSSSKATCESWIEVVLNNSECPEPVSKADSAKSKTTTSGKFGSSESLRVNRPTEMTTSQSHISADARSLEILEAAHQSRPSRSPAPTTSHLHISADARSLEILEAAHQPRSSHSPAPIPRQAQPAAAQKPKQKPTQGQGWHTLWSVDYTGKW